MWRFVRVEGVEPTNNQAERALLEQCCGGGKAEEKLRHAERGLVMIGRADADGSDEFAAARERRDGVPDGYV
jgi:hypothetical protein